MMVARGRLSARRPSQKWLKCQGSPTEICQSLAPPTTVGRRLCPGNVATPSNDHVEATSSSVLSIPICNGAVLPGHHGHDGFRNSVHHFHRPHKPTPRPTPGPQPLHSRRCTAARLSRPPSAPHDIFFLSVLTSRHAHTQARPTPARPPSTARPALRAVVPRAHRAVHDVAGRGVRDAAGPDAAAAQPGFHMECAAARLAGVEYGRRVRGAECRCEAAALVVGCQWLEAP